MCSNDLHSTNAGDLRGCARDADSEDARAFLRAWACVKPPPPAVPARSCACRRGCVAPRQASASGTTRTRLRTWVSSLQPVALPGVPCRCMDASELRFGCSERAQHGLQLWSASADEVCSFEHASQLPIPLLLSTPHGHLHCCSTQTHARSLIADCTAQDV
jgi:hypothetical protein